jgi:prepilin-type N-terminal cleavage/methylation domain-containing protein
MNKRGLTAVELLLAMALLALLFMVAVPGIQAFFVRLELHSGLRTVSAALGTARCLAILDGRPVRVEVASGRLLLSADDGPGWREFRRFDLPSGLAVKANSRPVFSPQGNAAPLCTIILEKQQRVRRVVLSMYGRIKVYGNG